MRGALAIASQNKLLVYQMDMKSSFLNCILEEEIYVDQPLGYTVKVHEHKVFNLKRPCMV